MRQFVLDCSVVMAWCFDDETPPYADGVRDALADAQAVVPSLWPLEVTNVLLVVERRGRLQEADASRFLALLQALPITVDQGGRQGPLHGILDLAREHGLSSYDAAYLELAICQGPPLATLDGRLREAAIRAGVPLVQAPRPKS